MPDGPPARTNVRTIRVTRKIVTQILTIFLYPPPYSCQTLTRYYIGYFQELGNPCNLEIRRLFRICWQASDSQCEARVIGPQWWRLSNPYAPTRSPAALVAALAARAPITLVGSEYFRRNSRIPATTQIPPLEMAPVCRTADRASSRYTEPRQSPFGGTESPRDASIK